MILRHTYKPNTKGGKKLYNSELEFEKSLVNVLLKSGWNNVINHPTEEDLINNWADILFANNKGIDKLNGCRLTKGEMMQIMEQIRNLRTPYKLNGFINGKVITITRDNQDDKLHYGKEVSLKIYDRNEVAAGQSVYQIAEQPEFKAKSAILNNRRGDLMLLINGMPVIHIELKSSSVNVSEACRQIEKYSYEGVFTGLFSLVQIFVAMNPEETVYFANPGPDGEFNKSYYFHWANINNDPINNWIDVAQHLLSIPTAHQMIGFYTVADGTDGILKVMRSYQYYAANAISDRVKKIKWDDENQLGGYIWHTTGSGKTMTSFKSAQLIADSGNADKVVFLTDRVELGTQSLYEYRAFADDSETVQATENTNVLISKLKSDKKNEDALIVTSIQKMSNIKEDEGLNAKDIEMIRKKRIVFIVDEAHRSTFGDMLITIKQTFQKAVFFGFTGTPIQDENQKKLNTTATIFGKELHRYSIADGIRDRNVLGFDIYKISTFREYDLRQKVALMMAKADSEEEAIADPLKSKVYYEYMDKNIVPMAGYVGQDGKYVKGIEDYIPKSQYETDEHRIQVVRDIKEKWNSLSHGGKFHALFATSSIPDAIKYYKLMKKEMPNINVSCLFDPSIDNDEGFKEKEDGIVEILEDYNKKFNQNYSIKNYKKFKDELTSKLAHKGNFKNIEKSPDEQIDILIVVDQLLTGFDSKWINTLYLDKLLEYENIIQAFSRTNRIYKFEEKPFGTIKYYRKPYTMEKNINAAVNLYSGNKPIGLFVQKLGGNINKMNDIFEEILDLFAKAGIPNFERLPDNPDEIGKFAVLFGKFNQHLEAAKIQGFVWDKTEYNITNEEGDKEEIYKNICTENEYLILINRYKEISRTVTSIDIDPVPFDIKAYITEIDTARIDSNYMNSRYEKYRKLLTLEGASKQSIDDALDELHKTFAVLSKDEQKYATIFLHDVERGDVVPVEGKTFKEYIADYGFKAKKDNVHSFAATFGLDEEKLRVMVDLGLNENNIDEFGRLNELKSTYDKAKAKEFFEKKEGKSVSLAKVNMKMDRLLRKFILTRGEIDFN